MTEVSMYLIICFLRARSRMCGRYLRSQLVHMTNIRVYNNSVGLQTLKLPLQSSQTVTHTAIGTLPGTAMHHSNTAQSRRPWPHAPFS